VLDQLSFTVNTPGTVGSVSLHLDPAHGNTFTPTSIVSAADSVLTGEFIIINAPAGAPFNGTAGATGTFVLGVFTGATLSPCNPGTCMPSNGLYEDPASLGPTVLDGALVNPVSNTFRIVPEPGSVVLLGIAAAGLALVRPTAYTTLAGLLHPSGGWGPRHTAPFLCRRVLIRCHPECDLRRTEK